MFCYRSLHQPHVGDNLLSLLTELEPSRRKFSLRDFFFMALFDNYKLIAAVQMNPSLWDKGHLNYADKQKKEDAWRAVMEVMWGEEEVESWDVPKKNLQGKDIQKKWKHLRNSFAREVAKRKKIKSESGRSWKTYIYYEQMSFLLPNMDHAEVQSNFVEDDLQNGELQNDSTITHEMSQQPPHISSSSRKRTSDTPQDSLAEIISESLKWMHQKEDDMDRDPDRLFLLSLLGDFRKVPDENKAQVKIALISAIEEGKIPKTVQQRSHLYNSGQFPPFDSRSSFLLSQHCHIPSTSTYHPVNPARLASSYNNKLPPTPSSRHNSVTVSSPSQFSDTNSECSEVSDTKLF